MVAAGMRGSNALAGATTRVPWPRRVSRSELEMTDLRAANNAFRQLSAHRKRRAVANPATTHTGRANGNVHGLRRA